MKYKKETMNMGSKISKTLRVQHRRRECKNTRNKRKTNKPVVKRSSIATNYIFLILINGGVKYISDA
jgi:hypothetical protein